MNNAARHAPHAFKTTKQIRHQNEEEPDELMLLATERYCHAEHYDRLTMRQYCEAFEILYPQIRKATLQVVARSLASCSFAPRAVIMTLAMEPIAVSRPVLLQSQVLGQLDMLRIIDVAGKRHAVMIAERHDIGPTVIKRLLDMEVEAINLALIENPALIDQANTLAENETKDRNEAVEQSNPAKSEMKAQQTAQLVTEPEISAREQSNDDALEDTLQIMPADEFEQRIINELESVPTAEPSTDLLRAAARGSRLNDDMKRSLPAMAKAEATKPIADLAGSLEKIAAAKSRQGMATLMAKASGFSLDTAFQVLEDTSGDTLAVFLKTHEIEPPVASRILMLTFPSIGLSTQNAMRAIRFYKTLEVESCREAVDQWPKDEPTKARHQPYLEDADGVRWASRENTYERRDVELEEARRQALS